MDKENKKEEEPSIVLRRRGNGMLKQVAVGAAEQSKSRDRFSPSSAGSTNLSLCWRNISLFQKREFLLVPDIISSLSEYRIDLLLNRI